MQKTGMHYPHLCQVSSQILQEIVSGTNLINETFVVSFVVGELRSRSVKQS